MNPGPLTSGRKLLAKKSEGRDSDSGTCFEFPVAWMEPNCAHEPRGGYARQGSVRLLVAPISGLPILPASKFARVAQPERRRARLGPFRELCFAGWRRVNIQEVIHQPPDFFACNHHVIHHFPDDPSRNVPHARWHGHDRPPSGNDLTHSLNQPAIGKGFRTYGVDNVVLRLLALFNGNLGKVIDFRAGLVAARAPRRGTPRARPSERWSPLGPNRRPARGHQRHSPPGCAVERRAAGARCPVCP